MVNFHVGESSPKLQNLPLSRKKGLWGHFMVVAQLWAQKNTKFEFSLLSWVSHAINISKQIHQTFPNSLCKRPNHTSVKVTQNPQGSQNPLLDITFLVLQLLLQNFDFAGRFEFFVQSCMYIVTTIWRENELLRITMILPFRKSARSREYLRLP